MSNNIYTYKILHAIVENEVNVEEISKAFNVTSKKFDKMIQKKCIKVKDFNTLINICKCLNVDSDYLLGLTESINRIG